MAQALYEAAGSLGVVENWADTDVTELSWQERALCAQTDPEAFYPEHNDRRSALVAKAVCRVCEVRSECLEYALEHNERFGIWGGLSERERRRLKRQSTR